MTGVVVNQRPNPVRAEVDLLAATLTNCVRHGLESQARGREHFREHLRGRIAWIGQLNPRRGARLAALLAKVP